MGTPAATPAAPTPEPPANAVVIQQGRYSPVQLFVALGAPVTWWNNDPVAHTVTFDDLSFDAELGPLAAVGNSAERTFLADGTFEYRCKLHPSMRGTIIAGSGVAPPAEATPPPTPTSTPEVTPAPEVTPTPEATPTPSPTPSPTPTATAPATPPPVTINIQGFAFVGTHTVPVGTTVTWKNLDSAPHTATANDGSFGTGTLGQGQTGSHTFTSAGSFPYKCAIHPSMTATLTVTA